MRLCHIPFLRREGVLGICSAPSRLSVLPMYTFFAMSASYQRNFFGTFFVFDRHVRTNGVCFTELPAYALPWTSKRTGLYH